MKTICSANSVFAHTRRVKARLPGMVSCVLAAMALLVLAAGCDEEVIVVLNQPNLVVVGDSLSAGHMNSCTYEVQQPHGYANVLADQAGWRLDLPLIGWPGARPCMTILQTGNPLSIVRVVPDPLNPADTSDPNDAATWGVRHNPTVRPDNLSAAGTRVLDVDLTPADSGFNTFQPLFGLDYGAMWTRMLDTPDLAPDKSMLDQALDRINAISSDRDIAIFWLGSNDSLWSAVAGTDAYVTPQAQFEAAYDAATTALDATGAEIVLASLPDLTAAPQFVPADTVAAWFGLTLATTDPNCSTGQTIGQMLGIQSADYVPMVSLPAVADIITCGRGTVLVDNEFLTAAEVTSIQAKIAAFNAYIGARATAIGAVHVDIAALLDDAKLNGRAVGAETLTTDLCGGLFSLDGVHPSYVGYAAVANAFITAMNAGLGLSIPAVDEAAVRAIEPPKHNCVAGA